MKLIQGMFLRFGCNGLCKGFLQPQTVRAFSINLTSGNDNKSNNSFESADDFDRRIFGDTTADDSNSSSFFRKLDRVERAHDRSSFDSGFGSKFNIRNRSEFMDGLDESFDTLSDGMDGKLKKQATYFEYDADQIELEGENYKFRPDVSFKFESTYDIKDLDLKKPGVRKPFRRPEFETTTEEVLRKADFRNVRFLANFITEGGIIIKRSKTGISAKAQRKVAREIKTARAFGLLPFTTMGTKAFVFGKTMEDLDEDYEYEIYDHNFVDAEASQERL